MNSQLFIEHQIFPQDKALSGQKRREEKMKNPENTQYTKQPNGDVHSANIYSIPCPVSTERLEEHSGNEASALDNLVGKARPY